MYRNITVFTFDQINAVFVSIRTQCPPVNKLDPPPLKFRIKSQQTILDEMFVHNFSGELYI